MLVGMAMLNSRRRIGAEGQRVRLGTLYFDAREGAEKAGDLVASFEAEHPFMNWVAINHEGSVPNDLPVAAEVEPIEVMAGLVKIQDHPTSLGDVNFDYAVDLSDAIALLRDLFLGDDQVICPGAADVNIDREVDITDAIAILTHLFLGGPMDPRGIYCDR